MDIDKKNRTELKQYFKVNDKPTEKQFADFIEAGINQKEDGIARIQGSPLAIEAEGEEVSTQEILDLYTSFTKENPDWSLNLNPRVDSQEPQSNQPGLNIKDATGQSRLFIKSVDGSVGVGTIEPESKLTIEGQHVDSLLSVIDTTQQHTKILEVTRKEGVTIKGTLTVDGEMFSNNIATNTELDNDQASNDKIPSQKAVKTYVDTRLPKGLISMWSGKDIPKGWVLCDGTNGTPNLSGKFIVGFDKNNEDYDEVKKTGGLEQVTLNKSQIPSHAHLGTTSEAGGHTHNFTGARRRGDGSGTGSANHYYIEHPRTTQSAGKHKHSFQTNTVGEGKSHENRPPYFVLAYIMKL